MDEKKKIIIFLWAFLVMGLVITIIHGVTFGSWNRLVEMIVAVFGLIIVIISIILIYLIRDVDMSSFSPIEIITSDIILIFQEPKGKIANYKKTQTCRAKTDNIASMIERGLRVSDGLIENFRVSENSYITKDVVRKGASSDIEVYFASPPIKGETFSRFIQCDFVDSFPGKEEWFEISISRKIKSLTAKIVAPKDKLFRDYWLICRYQNININKGKSGLTANTNKRSSNGREETMITDVQLTLTSPRIGSHYKIMWEW